MGMNLFYLQHYYNTNYSKRRKNHVFIKKISVFVAAFVLSSCGSARLSGTYADGNNMSTYEFNYNGKVLVSVMGYETEVDYEIDGDKLKIILRDGNKIFRIQEDGSFFMVI